VTGQPNARWWHALPPAQTLVPCGTGTHAVRWEAGRLCQPAHSDTEGELVLMALGGDKPRCVELAGTWARHADDLEVLAVGPRCPADKIAITWEDVEAFRSNQPQGWVSAGGPAAYSAAARRARRGVTGRAGSQGAPAGSAPGHPGRPPGPVPMRHQVAGELEEFRARRLDMLSLLALGPAFQMRLAATVAAAWSDAGSRAAARAAHRPALEAALTGRLAPAAAAWLGISPDRVEVSLHEGPGWGSARLAGHGTARRLRAQLPVGWLASVWACGLAVTGGHLVVAVDRAAWPDATVRALPAPDTGPVTLSVRDAAGTDAGSAHWEIAGT
jgi:hypothetical protein